MDDRARVVIASIVLAVSSVALASAGTRGEAPTGRIFFSADRGPPAARLFIVAADGSRLVRVPTRISNIGGPKWSQQLGLIAFVGPGERGTDIWVTDLRGRARQLRNDHVSDHSPTWTPDGRVIVFVSKNSRYAKQSDLYRIAPDSSGRRRLTRTPYCEDGPEISPDGQLIAATAGCGVSRPIILLRRDGSFVRQLTTTRTMDLEWSPDSRRIAFLNTDTSRLLLIDASGANESVVPVTDVAGGPAWSPDGRYLAYTRHRICGRSRYTDIWALPVNGGQPFPILAEDRCSQAGGLHWVPGRVP